MIREFAWVLIALLAASQMAVASNGLTVQDDIPYIEGSKNDLQKLNLFLPDGDQAKPILIWIGGGAWSYVDRHMESDVSRRIAADGIAVAAVGHRLSPAIWHNPDQTQGVQHPAHIKDIAAAVRWVWDNARSHNIDRERIFVGGFSSGAHLAALLVADPAFLAEHELSVDTINGVVAVSGTYDIPDYHRAFARGRRPELAVEHVEAVFSADAERQLAASPARYAETIRAPILLMSDRRTYNYTRIFEQALVDAGNDRFEAVHVRGLDHGPLWQNLSRDQNSPYRDRIVSFILHGLTGAEAAVQP